MSISSLTERELATLLAALRHWQQTVLRHGLKAARAYRTSTMSRHSRQTRWTSFVTR